MSNSKQKSLNICMTIINVVFIFCISVTIVLLFKPLYAGLCKMLDIPGQTGYSYDVCTRNYNVLIDYNRLFGAKELMFPDFPMSAAGAYHFKEVKQIFSVIQMTGIVSFFLLIPGIWISVKMKTYQWLKYTGIALLTIAILMGILILMDGETLFITMHKILFSNDYWMFDPVTDPIIWILPLEVFLAEGAFILFLVLLFIIVNLIVYRNKLKKVE